MKYAAIAALIAVASAADCPKTTKTTFYTDSKCTKVDEDKDAVEATDAQKEMMKKGGCIKSGTGSVKLECDAKGINMTVYTASTKCEKPTGDDAVTPKVDSVKYTECKKMAVGDKYYSFAGAAALKAAAIALVAIAGSQF
jgi:hypothetical protein